MGRCRCNFFIGEENPAMQNATEKERAAVVAWLHECANDRIAESIERGEHRREEDR
jgi:hypothetical protein